MPRRYSCGAANSIMQYILHIVNIFLQDKGPLVLFVIGVCTVACLFAVISRLFKMR